MANAQATARLGTRSNFVKAAREFSAAKTAETLATLAKEVDREFDSIVSSEFTTVADPSKRRSPGTRKLRGSSRTVVEWNGVDFPVDIKIKIDDQRQAVKVYSLNYGHKAFTQHGNPKLAFPGAEAGKFTARGFVKRKGAGSRGGSGSVVVDSVEQPKTQGKHFMERAIKRAVGRVYKTLR